jgi:hypothetical protein
MPFTISLPLAVAQFRLPGTATVDTSRQPICPVHSSYQNRNHRLEFHFWSNTDTNSNKFYSHFMVFWVIRPSNTVADNRRCGKTLYRHLLPFLPRQAAWWQRVNWYVFIHVSEESASFNYWFEDTISRFLPNVGKHLSDYLFMTQRTIIPSPIRLKP